MKKPAAKTDNSAFFLLHLIGIRAGIAPAFAALQAAA
jgi:hypothetical protein